MKKPVSYYVEILDIIESGMHVNQICRLLKNKTGFKNKVEVLNHLDKLHKANLINKKKMNMQKVVVEFTPLGQELKNIIDDLEKYGAAYLNLRNTIYKYFDLNTGRVVRVAPLAASSIRFKLKQKGWELTEVEKYGDWLVEIFQLENQLLMAAISAILCRYTSIVHRNQIAGLGKEILNFKIQESITYFVLDRLQGLLSEKLFSQMDEKVVLRNILHEIGGGMDSFFFNYTPPVELNRFIEKDNVELVKALDKLSLLDSNFLEFMMENSAKKDPVIRQRLSFLKNLHSSM
jgi:DNA-binding HxlR family transcriptional regulator